MSESWTVLKLLGWTGEHLKAKGVGNARREAEDLLGHVLDLDRLKLYLQFEYQPTPAELEAFRALVKRRAAREPLQHLLGYEEFWGMRLKCDRRALIPRPETEALAGIVIGEMGEALKSARCADIGTGTGCLALALKKAGAKEVWATDASADALSLAEENSRSLGLELGFCQGDLLEALSGGFDLIVSNPPYIAEGEREGLQPEVRDFDPALALFSGSDGLGHLRRLMQGAPGRLNAGGLLAMECGKGQAGLLAESPGFSKVWTLKDPFGVERYVMARK